jgi:hypothetical protein
MKRGNGRIEAIETFDAIAAMAKELPMMMPLTKELQKQFPDPVKAYIKEKRCDASRVHALFWVAEATKALAKHWQRKNQPKQLKANCFA